MKKKFVSIVLSFLIIFILFVIISSNITINKYNRISKTIDKDIIEKENDIRIKNNEYKKLKENNKTIEKQNNNMNNYINTLKEKVKEYEK